MARNIDPTADMAMIKQMIGGGEPQGPSSMEGTEDAALFERALGAKQSSPQPDHPDAAADQDMVMWHLGDRTTTQRVDASVHEWDTIRQGEPFGSVPLDRTMQRPTASIPVRPGPK